MSKNPFRLWPPVANAYDAFRRRFTAEPQAAYEHIWRLVHIHEAVVVTLGSALSTRLFDSWKSGNNQDQLNDLRKLMTGIQDMEIEAGPSARAESCFGGSISAWTDLLNRFGRKALIEDCPFCRTLETYLNQKSERNLAFVPAWGLIAPVPDTFREPCDRLQSMQAIISLRNKIAHVPIQQRILQDLLAGLKREALALITLDPENERTVNWHDPLRGAFVRRDTFVSGSDFGRLDNSRRSEQDYVHFRVAAANSDQSPQWVGDPFIALDDELKALLLFRLADLRFDTNDDLIGEYHRFAAEVQPVQHRDVSFEKFIKHWKPIPPPKKTVTKTIDIRWGKEAEALAEAPEDVTKLTLDQLRAEADFAYRDRDYEKAIGYYAELSRRSNNWNYNHVAQFKHGTALWRTAEWSTEITVEEKERHLREAIALLDRASEHVDPGYSAEARYQSSKASYHLWRYTRDKDDIDRAISKADLAATTAFDQAFTSWAEKLRRDRARLE